MKTLQLFATALLLLAVGETAAPAAHPERFSADEVDLKILKVFTVKDGGAVYRAYLVEWKGHEVVANDTMLKSEYRVGDTATIIVNRLSSSDGSPDRLEFYVFSRVKK